MILGHYFPELRSVSSAIKKGVKMLRQPKYITFRLPCHPRSNSSPPFITGCDFSERHKNPQVRERNNPAEFGGGRDPIAFRALQERKKGSPKTRLLLSPRPRRARLI